MSKFSSAPSGPSRRMFLRTGAGLGAAAGLGLWGTTAQAAASIDVVMVNAAISGPLRGVLEGASGGKINDAPWQSTTDVVSRLTAPGGTGRYDLLIAGSDFVRKPIMGPRPGSELVLPLDTAKMPNFGQVADAFKKDVADRNGKVYMVPVFWGFDSVIYNTEQMPESDPFTQSWAPLFEDKYAGRIAWYDAAHQMIMAAGLHLGNPKPEDLDGKDLDEVVRFLISRKKNIRTIWSTFAQGTNLLATGEVACLYGPIPVRAELQRKGFKITNAWPKEGVLSFAHSAFVPRDSKNLEASQAVINAMLGKDYASQVTKVSGYLSTSNLGSQDFSPEERKRFGYGVLDGSTKHHGLGFPPAIAKWIEGWNRVKSA
ncbi:ABC transporter substrate-binding protein [Bosea sp. (in: a-proteobacteria)]